MNWCITNETKYINSILNLPYIKELNKDNKIMCIKIDGSRASGLENEESDYDLTVLLDQAVENTDREFRLRYSINGRKTHFYLQGKDWFIANYDDFISYYIFLIGGLLQHVNFNANNIIYLNPIYKKQVQKILKNKQIFYSQGIYEISKNKDIINDLYFNKENIRKDLYPFFQSLKVLKCPSELIPTKEQLLKYKGQRCEIEDQKEQFLFFNKALEYLENNHMLNDHTEQLKEIFK